MDDEPQAIEGGSSSILTTIDFEEAVAAFFADAVHDSMCSMDRIFASLRRSVLPEGVRQIRVEVEGAANVSPEVHLSQGICLERTDVVAGNLERFHEAIAEIAEAHLAQFMGPFFDYVGDAAESVGNSMDFSGTDFGWDQILDCYEKVEWMPDEQGVVRPPQIAAGRKAVEKINNLPPRTPEQDNRLLLMWKRKQEEHDARRRRRRLRSESPRT